MSDIFELIFPFRISISDNGNNYQLFSKQHYSVKYVHYWVLKCDRAMIYLIICGLKMALLYVTSMLMVLQKHHAMNSQHVTTLLDSKYWRNVNHRKRYIIYIVQLTSELTMYSIFLRTSLKEEYISIVIWILRQ